MPVILFMLAVLTAGWLLKSVALCIIAGIYAVGGIIAVRQQPPQ